MKRGDPPKRHARLEPVGRRRRAELEAAGRRIFSTLAPRSARRRREDAARRRALHAAYGPNPPCWACPVLDRAGIETECDGRADDGHEITRAGQGGDRSAIVNVIPVGRACHRWITTHPAEAVDLGLARWRWRA